MNRKSVPYATGGGITGGLTALSKACFRVAALAVFASMAVARDRRIASDGVSDISSMTAALTAVVSSACPLVLAVIEAVSVSMAVISSVC